MLVDLRAGWALCGRGCILSMDLGWPGADMNSTKQAVVTTTRDKVSLGLVNTMIIGMQAEFSS